MSQGAAEFLETCREEGVAALERLIRQMPDTGSTKLVLTDHPDYEFRLGVAGTDGHEVVVDDAVEMIENFSDRYGRFLKRDSDDDDCFIDTASKWAWIRECWLAAGGRESGRTVVLFANGLGDMMDLNTGDEPDGALGIDDIC